MIGRARGLLTVLSLTVLGGCTLAVREPAPPKPPLSAELDRTLYNREQVMLFVSQDRGWQAWLGAMSDADRAAAALAGASLYNTSVNAIIQSITTAQDAYRFAMTFHLTPFTVTSGCLDLPSETTGAVGLADGLTIRYGILRRSTRHFANGSSCVVATGLIDEIDSSGGLPIAVAAPEAVRDWQGSFSSVLLWRDPFRMIATGSTLSRPDLLRLIEGQPPSSL